MKKTPKREPSDKNNQMSLRPMLSGLQDLETDSVTNLRSGMKMRNGFPIMIQMDTKVKMKMDWLKSKKVGIRVTCDGIRGTIPVSKSPAVASVVDSDCKVDLRIKIWKLSWWTPPSRRRALCSPCRTPKHRFYYSDSPPSPSRLQDLPRGADVPDGENIHRRRSKCLI
ncbi:uncharacterized protein LOC124823928 [Vigna umbellata]|uniref:uncharacterized protein LOC124823928 n=1 Tax=Vigna umbellata TaxID=87088 RepID=UPI001F5EEE4E|nr:uncharacterized protein LOC124823928 [Vigna umbellata]